MEIRKNVLMKVYDKDIKDGKFVIPEGIATIERYAFYGCYSLTSITIPDSVTSIGNFAFLSCGNLMNVTMGNGVTSIGDHAFENCHSLTSITIPDSVTSLGDYAFYYCISLTSVTIGNGVTSIRYGTFCDCRSLTNITIPDSVTRIGDDAFNGCINLTSITIPDSVMRIGGGAFSYCNSLKSRESNYKAFKIKNEKLFCRNKEYKVGRRNFVQGELKLCYNGIHYCTNLFEVFNYYWGEIDKDIAIYEIEPGSKIIKDDCNSKCCTNLIRLGKRLYREDIIRILNGGDTM